MLFSNSKEEISAKLGKKVEEYLQISGNCAQTRFC